MNNSVKSSLGMLLADLFRYYYFDSDALVSEVAGGESAAISLKESDEKGFRESEVLSQLMALYEDMRRGYATADATVSLQKVAYQLGYEDMDAVTTEDITMEVLKEIERLTRVKKMMEAAARPLEDAKVYTM
ncbi:SKI domain-containing protein [Gossypium australe]|uniref:SKI domain-containing protein n=1 Tax=Gossypium australe TaxID=47621 RepID=A0A5B6V4Q3_9ROSI|nr:SKI domain-containing protein [Gossypium australe]